MLRVLKSLEQFYKVIIVIIDLLLLNFGYVLAFLIKFNFNLPEFNFSPYLDAMPFITIASLVYLDIYGMLKFYRKSLYDTVISSMLVIALLSITTVAITYFNQGFSFPRSVLLTAPIYQFILLVSWKGFLLYIKRYLINQVSLMIVGGQQEVDLILDKLNNASISNNFKIKYIFSPFEIDTIITKIKEIDEVFICAGVSDDFKMKIISNCIGSKRVVYIVPQLFEISLISSRMIQFQDVPAFMIDKLDLSLEQKVIKRLFDICISFIGIVFSFPLMAIITLLIKLTSKGKVIYSQERVTQNNKVFKVYKFRTMFTDAEITTGPVLSGKDDPRVTPFGKFLRSCRLDELPQLFNVLLGEMSIVGPRPERPFFVEQYCKGIPEYKQRSVVKAGITGYAQILGNYDTSPEDKLRYDLLYIKNYSLLLDIKLILQTIKVMFTGESASHKLHIEKIPTKSKVVNF